MILKHRDRELLRFEWTGARGVRVLSVNESERKFLPIGMFGSASDASLWKWISTRTVPRGRKYILSALRQLGIPSDDIRAIVNFSRGLSLNDVYWIVEDGFTGCWKDYNLYENDFSEDVAALALKHYNLVDERLDVIESFIQERVENILNYGEKADALLSMGNRNVGKIPPKTDFENDKNSNISSVNNALSRKSVGIKSTFSDSLEYQILQNMIADKYITASEIADILSVDARTIERKIRTLRENGRVSRVGSRKAGYWKVS